MDGDPRARPEIPDKTFFKIGEVADLVGVKPYVLRFWESEFQALSPRKARSRHRVYERSDIELLLTIKTLLHDQKYTIAGAQRRLTEMVQEGKLRIPDESAALDEEPGDPDDPGEPDEPADLHDPHLSHLGDAFEGAGQAVLEQEVAELRAAFQQTCAERDEAVEIARLATDAIGEAERAHASTQADLDHVRAELRALQDDLATRDAELRAARSESRRQAEHADALLIQLQALAAERDALKAAAPDEAQIARATEDEWLREAQQAAVLEAQRKQKELRARLHDQVFKTRQLLQTLRSEMQGLAAAVTPPDE